MIVEVPEIYQALYTTEKPIILVTGGRGGAKSFNISLFLKRLSFEAGHNIYFTRYTMSSAEKSVIPDFKNKIEIENHESYFDVTNDQINNKYSGSVINFTGIKTSSGQQTAKMKGMSELTVFVVDEAEEWVSFEEFEKVRLSARKKGANIKIIIVMNPSNKKHFVYERFIKDNHKIVDFDGCPIEISTHPRVEHIHSTYLDNLAHLDGDWLEDVIIMKEERKGDYNHKMLGSWNEDLDGTVFKRDKLNFYNGEEFNSELTESKLGYIDVADTGLDRLSFPICEVQGNKVFINDVIFTSDDTTLTIPRSSEKINAENIEFVRVETNNQGNMFANELTNNCHNTTILRINNQTNKHTRIIMQQFFIQKHVYFRSDYEHGSEYHYFVEEILEYLKDGKSKHDDAPDALAGLCAFIRSYLPHLFE